MTMSDKDLKSILSPSRSPEPASDSPDLILRDLMQAEKEIASENIHLIKSRHEKEKMQWDALLQEKQRAILDLQSRLEAAESTARALQKQLDEEALKQIEQLKLAGQEMELRKTADRKKWQMIEDEIKSFRVAATEAQNKLLTERDKMIELKKNFEYSEKLFREQLEAKEEEILQVKEVSLKKEEAFLRDKALKDEEVHLLQEQLKNTADTAASERKYGQKVIEEKDKALFELQNGIQNAIVQLTTERQNNARLNEKISELQKNLDKLDGELKTLRQVFDDERLSMQRTIREEQSNLEKAKQENAAREDQLRKDMGEQVQRLAKSGEILEQQLAEEQRLRKSAESKLQQKEAELAQLLKQNEEIASDWKKIIASEREAWQKRQSDASVDLEKQKQAKEEEITSLHQKINTLMAEINNSRRPHFKKKFQNPKPPAPPNGGK